ncbi:MAG: type II toxin-antitoxin system RelE/ParE family toxin [Solirubrobacterales bacterium]
MSDAPWRVELSRGAQRDLRRLDPQVRRRVERALRDLAAGRATRGERKLTGSGEWRLRVGDWRVRFERDAEKRAILVVRILPRGRAYER